MPMRVECRHYETRTYASGDTVRKCDLNLAPEAPWRCPDPCAAYQRRTDVAWSWGSAVAPPAPAEPEGEGIAELLAAAKSIVNAAGPDILHEVEADRKRRKGRFGRLLRRRR